MVILGPTNIQGKLNTKHGLVRLSSASGGRAKEGYCIACNSQHETVSNIHYIVHMCLACGNDHTLY